MIYENENEKNDNTNNYDDNTNNYDNNNYDNNNYDNNNNKNMDFVVYERNKESKIQINKLETKIIENNVLPNIIYRFKFTEEFMKHLYNFSKIHQYDDRKNYKEAWNTWIEDNENIINDEIHRLKNIGYQGNILDKMFKSARYYFKNKSNEIKEPKHRRSYISVNKDLLDAMDIHIKNNIYIENYQPKTGFIIFCKDNEKLLKDTISYINENDIKDLKLIENKIKKTYKNRYFMLTNK